MSTVYIPHDLVSDILLRLRVKSLTRFKCVSKLWCRIIDSPGFIKIHLEQSKFNMKLIAEYIEQSNSKINTQLIAEYIEQSKSNMNFNDRVDTFNKTRGLHLYDVGFTLGELSNMKEIYYPVIMDDFIYRISFAGSCNGLICLVYRGSSSQDEETIVLWNFSTRKHLQLPIRPLEYRKNMALHCYSSHGLGYDESTDDYKVVWLERYSHPNRKAFYDLSLFSLKSKKWKKLVNITHGDELIINSYETVLANGALHWLLSNNTILALNLETDEIQFPPPPETSTPIECSSLAVAFLNGCQHLVFNDISAGQKWITKDKCGSNYSWTKLTFDFSAGKQLLIMRMLCYSEFFDLFCFRKPEVEFPVKLKYLQAHLCFESLVRLDDACEKNDVTSFEQQVGEGRKIKQRDYIFIEENGHD